MKFELQIRRRSGWFPLANSEDEHAWDSFKDSKAKKVWGYERQVKGDLFRIVGRVGE